VFHRDRPLVVRGEDGGGLGDGSDVAARQLEPGEELVVESLDRGRLGEDRLPDGPANLLLGSLERDGVVDAPHERAVDVRLVVARQQDDAVVGLDPLEQVVDLHVRVAVGRVGDRGPVPENGVGLVEQQNRVGVFGLGENLFEVLLGLADVLAHDRGEVDLVQFHAGVGGDYLRGHRLPRPRGAGEQRNHARSAAEPLLELPLGVDPPLVGHVRGDRPEFAHRVGLELDVLPPCGGFELLGQVR